MKKIVINVFLIFIVATLFAQVSKVEFYGTWVATMSVDEESGVFIIKISEDEFVMETITIGYDGKRVDTRTPAKITNWFNTSNNDFLTKDTYPYGVSLIAFFPEDDATAILEFYIKESRRELIWTPLKNNGKEVIFLKQENS